MDNVILTIAVGYGIRYISDKVASKMIGAATTVAKKKAYEVIYRDNSPLELEYEFVQEDCNNDNIIYVTSKKHTLIDQSWNDISSIHTPTPPPDSVQTEPSDIIFISQKKKNFKRSASEHSFVVRRKLSEISSVNSDEDSKLLEDCKLLAEDCD